MFPECHQQQRSVASTISVTVTARPLDTVSHIIINSTNCNLETVEVQASGVPTRTTPTLTPTTLKNIEQLLDLPSVQPPEVHFNQAGFVPPPIDINSGNTFISVDNKGWGGGVTTLTKPSSPESEYSLSPVSSPMPSLSSIPRSSPTGRKTGGRKPKHDDSASPEEEEKKQLRRERNKQAAARCRKRRLDQTMQLQDETEGLECKKDDLKKEIQTLQQQKEELEFVLAAHKTNCKKSNLMIKVEVEEWQEPPLIMKPQRPTSLSLGGTSGSRGSVIADLGIAIETPSHGIRGLGLNFESMMEGGTGLTPVSGVITPIVSTGLTPLTTPIVSTAPTNCSSQQRSSSDILDTHKLVSL